MIALYQSTESLTVVASGTLGDAKQFRNPHRGLWIFGAKRRLAMMGWTAPDGIISATLVYVSFQRKENRP
jgi:hypothetical protein